MWATLYFGKYKTRCAIHAHDYVTQLEQAQEIQGVKNVFKNETGRSGEGTGSAAKDVHVTEDKRPCVKDMMF